MNAAPAAAQAEHASESSTVPAPSRVPPDSAEAANSAMIRTAPGTVMVSSTAGTAARMSPRTIARACPAVGARPEQQPAHVRVPQRRALSGQVRHEGRPGTGGGLGGKHRYVGGPAAEQ